MDISVFTDKTKRPTEGELKKALGKSYVLWKETEEYVFSLKAALTGEWKHSGAKYGWSYRIPDKKRILIYMLPREGYFKVAFVFGEKAYEKVLESKVSESIIKELKSARVYMEGRGIRIEIKNKSAIKDVKLLTSIKFHA